MGEFDKGDNLKFFVSTWVFYKKIKSNNNNFKIIMKLRNLQLVILEVMMMRKAWVGW